jgi:hypothetical protein
MFVKLPATIISANLVKLPVTPCRQIFIVVAISVGTFGTASLASPIGISHVLA